MEILKNPTYEVQGGKIAMIVLIAFALFVWIYGTIYSRSLQKNFVVTSGKIIALTNFNRSSPTAEFISTINGKIYNGSVSHPDFKNFDNRYILIGKFFPVVVDSTHCTHNRMLFDSLSFVEYRLRYPDSLRWLQKYLE